LALKSNDVHVWRASLDLPAWHVRDLQGMLAADELGRAMQFKFQKDRRRFVAGRGLLRVILGLYLDVEPRHLHFCYSNYGKPALAPLPGQEPLTFNISHSDGLALYAISRSRDIGVDVERIRFNVEYERLAERFFSRQENTALRALPSELKLEAFLNCWTRKEAYIKARGEGLSFSLDEFDVSLVPGEPAKLLSARSDPQEARRWSLQEIEPGPGFVAALAVEGHDWQLKCWQWMA